MYIYMYIYIYINVFMYVYIYVYIYIYICMYICIYTYTCRCAASFQELSLEKWALPLGDLNFQRACLRQDKQRSWDSRPSILNVAN